MSSPKVVKEEIVERNTRFLAVFVETKNACLILLSESEDYLGTLAIAVPPPKGLGEIATAPATSSILLGDRNIITARMFAEHVATNTNKIALVSVYLRTINEAEARPILLKLIEKIIKNRQSPPSSQPEKEGVSA
ncbi:hypothetical protein DRO34_03365 [Candidatus Bathyarchaeota archaeon]|nr:MAG: hypothetical protein DRO34_03365 [Candidatus Bathyarchaeota archaeon]